MAGVARWPGVAPDRQVWPLWPPYIAGPAAERNEEQRMAGVARWPGGRGGPAPPREEIIHYYGKNRHQINDL